MTAPIELAVLAGDGIGAEVVPAALEVAASALARHGRTLNPTELPYGATAIATHGVPVPDETLTALRDYPLWLVGPHDSAAYPPGLTHPAPGATLRQQFDLFANLRPARAVSGVRALAPDLDVLIVRENSEGLYADRNMAVGSGEFMPTPDVALTVGVITRAASERIAVAAFDAARRRRSHVTIVHKANVLRLTTGLFRDVCLEVAARYRDVRVDTEHVDAMAALLVRRPADFDVIVTENLFGDILSDLAGELAGSLGLAPSVNTSPSHAMAQAVHGAAPDIAGRNTANPMAMISSMALGLSWLGERTSDASIIGAARATERAVDAVLRAGTVTPDLGGTATTVEVTQAVLKEL